jgi:hypothetical protein
LFPGHFLGSKIGFFGTFSELPLKLQRPALAASPPSSRSRRTPDDGQRVLYPLRPDEGSEVAVRALNEFVRSRTGWIIAVPGDVDVECLPGSSSPDEPQARGYDRTVTGNGERIVPTAITERFCMGADGELELLTSDSTAGFLRWSAIPIPPDRIGLKDDTQQIVPAMAKSY